MPCLSLSQLTFSFLSCAFSTSTRESMQGGLVFEGLRGFQSLFLTCVQECRHMHATVLVEVRAQSQVLALSFGSAVCYGVHKPSWPGSFQASPILPHSAGVADTCYRVQFYMGTSNPGPYPCTANAFPLSHLPVLFFPHRYLTSWLDTGGNNFFFGILKIHLCCPSAALRNSEPL